jgi:hypothetical protein
MAPEVKGLGGDKALEASRDLSHTVIAGLKERVLAATGADREIDRTTAVAVDGFFVERRPYNDPAYCVIRDGETFTPGRKAGDAMVPLYSASIDAAIALVERVLPKWFWSLGQPSWDAPAVAELCCEDPPGYAKEEGETPALALLAALLTALDEDSGMERA